MNLMELQRTLRQLRLGGMAAVLETRLHQAQAEAMAPIDLISCLLSDELGRRSDRLLERRRQQAAFRDPLKTLDNFDFTFNPKMNRSLVFDLATCAFIAKREDGLFLGPGGTGKSHLAQAIGQAAIQQNYRVMYRETHVLLDHLAEAVVEGTRKQFMESVASVPLLIIDDFGMRKLPLTAAEDLLEIIMRRYERASTLLTSNRPVEDWGKLLGDVAAVTAMLDRLLHHGHVLKCGPRSWRTKLAAATAAQNQCGERKMGNREGKGVFVNLNSELDTFKRRIDLRQFAVSLGYEMDRRQSWRGSTVLRRGADKIVVKRNGNGHYVFFSVRDDDDHGTLIDFLQRRQNLSLGTVRQILRPWIGRPATTVRLFPKLEPTSSDRMRVENEYRRVADALRHPYLEDERCLPATLLTAPRFAGRVRSDSRGNAVFPHFDAVGLCGYEIKNTRFTGFAAGGKKGLWFSHTGPNDRRLVLAECAIDALSHAALFPDAEDRTRYASLGGKPNSKQPGLVQATIARLPEGSEVVAAFDADEAGRLLVDMLRLAVTRVANAMGRTDLIFQAHLPAQEGDDWNQVLQMAYIVRHSNPTSQSDRTKSKFGLPQGQPAR